MDLTPEPLTQREQQLVEIERRRGVLVDGKLPALRKQYGDEWGGKLRGLRRAWDALPPDAREFLAQTLADQAWVGGAGAGDVGAAADEVLAIIKGRRVAPVPGVREASVALHAVWIERGGSPTVRNLDRDRIRNGGPGPSDLHLFIGRHLIALFGREAFGGSLDDERVLDAACTAADTALR